MDPQSVTAWATFIITDAIDFSDFLTDVTDITFTLLEPVVILITTLITTTVAYAATFMAA